MSAPRTIRPSPSRSKTAPTWSRSISAGRNRGWRLVFAVAAFLSASGAHGQEDGRPADTLRYPYVAAISRATGENRVYFCAGALVAPQWILTAAHCFRTPRGARIGTADLWAEVGASWLGEVPEAAQVRVERILVHPDYDAQNQNNDIALVRLDRVVGPLIADIATAPPPSDPAGATALGFGSFYEGRLAANATSRTGAPAAQVSDRLRQAAVRLIPPRACAAMLGIGGEATGAYQVCAGACVGDSGGPLIVEGADGADRLAGVVSFGSGCAAAAAVTVYTRVSAYAGWIADTIAGR